jgi:hypothetical protein
MHLGRAETHLVGIVVTRFQHPAENVAHLGLVVDEAQQRLAARALLADAEDVLGGGVEVDDQQAVVDENDACAQAVENAFGIVRWRATVVAGACRAV